MAASAMIGLIEPLRKIWQDLYGRYKKNPSHYLEGWLTSGLDVAYRVIALFEAHEVKRTQIYRILGETFQEITPSLDAEKLQTMLNEALIRKICEFFGVQRAWLEGEDVEIYETLDHYKDFSAFVELVGSLKEHHPDEYCLLTMLKSSGKATDLYADRPEIALYFSEPIAQLDDKTIYRHLPIFGPFPWDHAPARFHICAFARVVDNTRGFLLKGYSVSRKYVEKLSEGKAIPHHKMKIKWRWRPDDYAYPEGQYNGRVKSRDWQDLLAYFKGAEILSSGPESLGENSEATLLNQGQ